MLKLPIITYVKKFPLSFIIMNIVGVTFNSLLVYTVVLFGRVIDAAVSGNFQSIMRSVIIYMVVLIVCLICRFLKRFSAREFAIQIEADMRKEIFNSILYKNSRSLDNDKIGDLMSRATIDIGKVTAAIRKTTIHIWDTLFLILAYFVTLLFMNTRIALITFIFIPVSIACAELVRHALYKHSKRYSVLAGRISSNLQQTLIGIPVLRLFGAEKTKKKDIDKLCRQQMKTNLKMIRLQSAMVPVFTAIASTGIVIVIIMGGNEVVNGSWTIGTFWAFLFAYTAMTTRTPKAASLINQWHTADASWDRINEELGNKAPDTSMESRVLKELNIEVKNLSFQYQQNTNNVVDDTSFCVNPNEFVGITGPVGCGKTALCLAMTGIYEYDGDILINGVQLSELSDIEKSRIISYLGHEQYLFSASVKDNIIMDFGNMNLDVDEKLLNDVIHYACLEEDIKTMTDGVDTIVGERGIELSGGQKQRIALARAIYQNRPLLLMDDPFSALDTITEHRILERLKSLDSKTIILFSHRLGAFRDTDKIIVMENGSISESGTHDELMNNQGVYQKIFTAQNFEEDYDTSSLHYQEGGFERDN